MDEDTTAVVAPADPPTVEEQIVSLQESVDSLRGLVECQEKVINLLVTDVSYLKRRV
jgi:hypothetical protein